MPCPASCRHLWVEAKPNPTDRPRQPAGQAHVRRDLPHPSPLGPSAQACHQTHTATNRFAPFCVRGKSILLARFQFSYVALLLDQPSAKDLGILPSHIHRWMRGRLQEIWPLPFPAGGVDEGAEALPPGSPIENRTGG